MNGKRILIVDDDSDLSFIISEMLSDHGYETACAESGEEAVGLLTKGSFHLVLLDINLPDTEGFVLCRELRKASDIPVIFASARTSENDRVTGFDNGGDDFILKPYSMKELLSRVNALMRRVYGFGREDKSVSFGSVTVDIGRRTVLRNGESVSLSLREFDLLAYLCLHPNKAVPKERLINEVWGAFSEAEPSTLTVHIRWLREKLEDDPSKPKYIRTVWGVGYMLEVET